MENSKEDINITVSQLIDLKKRLKKTQDSIRNENVIIGDYTYGTPTIKSYSMVKLKIGKFCSIASNVTFLLGGEHRPDYFTTYPFNIFVKDFKYIKGHPRIKGDVEVGNDVWIGHGAKILSGVKIGDGAVIGANAVVTKDVPNYAIAVGNPIKIIRYRFDEDTIKKLEEIQWWNFEESKLVRIIPFLQNNDMESLLNEIENLD